MVEKFEELNDEVTSQAVAGCSCNCNKLVFHISRQWCTDQLDTGFKFYLNMKIKMPGCI